MQWNKHLVPKDTPVCAAVSGGADSMAMLDLLYREGFEVTALHCNFGLRGKDSDEDEAAVITWCHERDIPLRTTRFDTLAVCRSTGESTEMAARRLRYDWFCEVAAEVCPTRPAVVVAHHADDNAETLLLNLLRGTGIHGMTGMKAQHTYTSSSGRRIEVLRPLLGVSRQEIMAYVADKGIAYRTDKSNADTTLRRNYLRHRVLPLLREVQPAANNSLAQAMTHLADAESLVALAVKAIAERACQEITPTPSARLRGIRQADLAIRHEGLAHLTTQQRRAALYELTREYGFERKVAASLAEARTGAVFSAPAYDLCVTSWGYHIGLRPDVFRVQGLSLPTTRVGDCQVSLELCNMGDTLPRPSALPPSMAMLDADTIDLATLQISGIAEGSRFRPYGMRHGTRLVSDYLTDRHRSRIDKQRALCVKDTDGILWLVGETIADRAAVTTKTQRVLIISIK